MRKFPILIVLILVGCGGNGNGVEVALESGQHVPEISNLTLSPDSALYMEGNGSVQVTAEFFFTDVGRDIETLNVKMSDGATLAFVISGLNDSISGTLTKTFDVATADVNGCTVEIWLVDNAGQSSNHLSVAFGVIQHTPEIVNVNLSPDSVRHMEGDGSVAVTAEITFRDAGSDVANLWVRMPDDSTIEFDETSDTDTGTFAADLVMSTETVGAFAFEFWLVDRANDRSSIQVAWINVRGETQAGDWMSRLSGLPHALNDIIWDSNAFIAVGDGGTVLTSADGIDWVARQSGTTADLNAIASYGSEIFAVGDETVLLSTDHGENWMEKDTYFFAVDLTAVAVTSSQVVVSGFSYGLAAGIISRSEDRGDTWHFADFKPSGDIIYRDGLFVAAVNGYLSYRARVATSFDGSVWNEIIVREGEAALETIVHDGSQFIVAGSGGAVFASFDGFNWTERQTPVRDVFYLSSAWNGLRLLLAGGSMCGPLYFCDASLGEVPVGLSSTDGGLNWDIFNIDSDYTSFGLAWGNGRFVSVGQIPGTFEGAIYTAE